MQQSSTAEGYTSESEEFSTTETEIEDCESAAASSVLVSMLDEGDRGVLLRTMATRAAGKEWK